jgi:hypothetical protein
MASSVSSALLFAVLCVSVALYMRLLGGGILAYNRASEPLPFGQWLGGADRGR